MTKRTLQTLVLIVLVLCLGYCAYNAGYFAGAS